MVLRIVTESLRRRAKSRLAAVLAVALGAGAASGLVMILLGVGDRMAAEMAKTGANIEILPGPEGPLLESELGRLRETFWKNALVRVTPELRLERSGFTVVGREPDGDWRIEGRPGVLAGVSLGIPVGSTLDLGRPLTVTGTVATGGEEDEELVVGLALAQELSGTPGRISRVWVSAVVRPETEEFRQFQKHPRAFTPAEQERMQCANFPTNVARAYGAALGAQARVIRKVAETDGAVLRRIEMVVWALAAGAVLAGCLSVLASVTAGVVERRKEIGLLKALGATDGQVAVLFLAEALLVGLAGSLAGYAIGLGAAKSISRALFDDPVSGSLGVYLATLGTSLAIVGLGVAGPLRRVVSIRPQIVLHEA